MIAMVTTEQTTILDIGGPNARVSGGTLVPHFEPPGGLLNEKNHAGAWFHQPPCAGTGRGPGFCVLEVSAVGEITFGIYAGATAGTCAIVPCASAVFPFNSNVFIAGIANIQKLRPSITNVEAMICIACE